jgi:putative inorganic carbon (HCO3(-)) transporter
MRDLLIVGIVLVCLPFALRHTWIAVMLWTWISVMNPHRLTYGFAHDAPLAAIAAGAALISLFVTRDKLRMPWSPPVIALICFVLWMCLTTAFSVDLEASSNRLNDVLKTLFMTAIALIALQERKHIEMFIWVATLSIGFFAFKGGLFTLLTGGAERVWGPPGGFFQDNNAFAVATVMVMPMMHYLRMVATRPWVRHGLLVLLLLSSAAALGTQSRGGLLAIAAMGLVFWYRSDRKMLVGVIVLFVGVALLAFMPQSWEARMWTIQTYDEDASASQRLEAWQTAINVGNSRPLGLGFAMYNAVTAGIYAPPGVTFIRAAHSIYFQVLGEHGYVGLVLFVLIWWLTFRVAAQLRREARNRPEVAWVYTLAGMCQVSLVAYLVGGAFLSLAYFDMPYNVMVILVVTQRWLRENSKNDALAAASLSRAAVQPNTTQQALP